MDHFQVRLHDGSEKGYVWFGLYAHNGHDLGFGWIMDVFDERGIFQRRDWLSLQRAFNLIPEREKFEFLKANVRKIRALREIDLIATANWLQDEHERLLNQLRSTGLYGVFRLLQWRFANLFA